MNKFGSLFLCSAILAAPIAQAEPDAKRGEQLFTALCAAYCHSRDSGHREAPFLFDCEWVHGGSEDEIFATVSNGVPGTRMMAFGGKLPNGDDDIRNLIGFISANSNCKD